MVTGCGRETAREIGGGDIGGKIGAREIGLADSTCALVY